MIIFLQIYFGLVAGRAKTSENSKRSNNWIKGKNPYTGRRNTKTQKTGNRITGTINWQTKPKHTYQDMSKSQSLNQSNIMKKMEF